MEDTTVINSESKRKIQINTSIDSREGVLFYTHNATNPPEQFVRGDFIYRKQDLFTSTE